MKWLTYLLLLTGSCYLNAVTNENVISVVYKVIEGEDNQVYLVTDNGTWKIKQQYAVRMDRPNSIVIPISDLGLEKLGVVAFDTRQENNWNAIFILIVGVLLATSVFILQRSAHLKNKQYMTTLRQQKRLMDLCFWVTGDTVLDCDIELNYVEKVTNNDAFFELDGIPFLSQSYLQKIHPDDLAIFRGQYESILSAGNNSFQIMYRFSDGAGLGQWKWIVERGCVIERSETGQAKRIVTNLRDETELRREQNNLVRINHALEKKIRANLKSAENSNHVKG